MAFLYRALLLAAQLLTTLTVLEGHESSRLQEFVIDSTGAAVVTNVGGLHTALSPKVLASIDRITVVHDIILDPLSLVPLFSSNKSLSICGSPPGVVLSATERFEVLNVNSTLTLCNVTIETAFPVVGTVEGVGSALFEASEFAQLRFRDVSFRVQRDTSSQFEVNVQVNATPSAVNGLNVLRNVWVANTASNGASIKFENVTVTASESEPPLPSTATNVTEVGGLSAMLLSTARGSNPVELRISGNFSFTQCLLDEINDGQPINVLRPLTLRAGEGGAWLSFDRDFALGGFFRIQNQIRLVGVNLGPEFTGELDKLEETETSPKAFVFDGNSRSCRVVGVNLTAVKPCSVVNRLATQMLLRTSGVDLIDLLPLDSRTVRLDRYSSQGECYQNVTFTCRDGITLENAKSQECRGSR